MNQAELPDIKVIRTGFIINFFAVTLTLCVAFLLLQREYRSYTLRQTISQMQQQVRVADADDVENLKQSEKFRQSAQYVVEVQQFFDAPLLAHEFLLDLSLLKPDDLIFQSVSLSESITKQGNQNVVSYVININGNAKNLTVLDDFKQLLEEDALLQIEGFVVEIDETLQGRDEKTGIFPYRLGISLTPGKTAAATKEGDAS
ncbi:hypothetical protein [Thalassobacterium sedimentorum]|uniref:hypothetical protein n=1 Tax=Thalassobacterium sedimentorum TaxID=3041258 RepID=UPI002811E5A0|nr:hypothetical protein [Coraliomargarita sp. SDUM461004]